MPNKSAEMYYLIYTSTPSKACTSDELADLLTQFREKNFRLGVTGMLVWLPEMVIQLIEGSEENVKLLFASIEQDNRHNKVIILKEGPAEKRQFPDWSMGFHANREGLENIPGFEDLRHLIETGMENAKTAQLLALLE